MTSDRRQFRLLVAVLTALVCALALASSASARVLQASTAEHPWDQEWASWSCQNSSRFGEVSSPVAQGKAPRRRVLMHVIDAGDHGCVSNDAGIAVYKCRKCGHETDWTPFRTFTEAKRGVPCPDCNHITACVSP